MRSSTSVFCFNKVLNFGQFVGDSTFFVTLPCQSPLEVTQTLNTQHYENEGKSFNFNGGGNYRNFNLLRSIS